MNIIVAGCGSVGTALIKQLVKEDHNITVIDSEPAKVKEVVDTYDVMGIAGNAASYSIMKEAGIEEANLMIAVTNFDELNLLCCLIANKAGDCRTVARVRNPVYKQEVEYIKEELGLSMVINPEEAAAGEAMRLLKFPSAKRVESFARGRVEMVTIVIDENSPLVGKTLINIRQRLKANVLFSVVSRKDEVIIPDGSFIPEKDDEITLIGITGQMMDFFRAIKVRSSRVHSAMIVGGGSVSFYLAQQLLSMGVDVRIFEAGKTRAKELSMLLPEALIINGSGVDKDMLMEEGLEGIEAFAAFTERDEENIMLSMYANTMSKAKRITLVHHVHYNELIGTLNVGSVIDIREITAHIISQFVRGMSNSMGSDIEALYPINDGKAEVLEFLIKESTPIAGIRLADMNIKKGVLVASIIRKNTAISPSGNTKIKAGDRLIIVTTLSGFDECSDILDDR